MNIVEVSGTSTGPSASNERVAVGARSPTVVITPLKYLTVTVLVVDTVQGQPDFGLLNTPLVTDRL
eukprot:1364294-Pyramimonas_sp.AAC.1